MQIPEHVFREYDIRGYVDRELTNEFAYALGRAYATLAKDNNCNNIAIGWDARITSPAYAKALAQGLSDEGVSSTLCGMGPTPQLYYAVFTKNFGGGIQVTGSHNPSDMNGFKILLGKDTLSGAAIQDIKQRVKGLTAKPNQTGVGKISEADYRQEYTQYIIDNVKPQLGKRKIKVVCDAGNGVGGLVGPAVLRALGVEVIELFCEPDGRFPNHHPDPTELKNLKALIAKVKECGADFGIGWDGDADRIGVIDENGLPIFGDMLVLLYARDIQLSVAKPTVIADVKCSSLLFDDLTKRGANPIMWKTGHSLIKNKLKETHGELAGEMSGHIFFKHRFFGFDDAIYATARFIELFSKSTLKASELLSDLPKTISTPEIRVDCPEEIKFKVTAAAQTAFPGYKVNTLDGARIEFPHGWALVRASNTQPVLVMRFEADSEDRLNEYRNILTKKIEEVIASLS